MSDLEIQLLGAAAGRGEDLIAQWDLITYLEGWCLVLCLPLLSWEQQLGGGFFLNSIIGCSNCICCVRQNLEGKA